jgi:hypothetical protein
MGRTAAIVSDCQPISSHQQHPRRRAIDVHTGAGNFLNGATPSQDIVAVFSGGDDGGSGGVVMGFGREESERFSRLRLPKLAPTAAESSGGLVFRAAKQGSQTCVGPEARIRGNDSPRAESGVELR